MFTFIDQWLRWPSNALFGYILVNEVDMPVKPSPLSIALTVGALLIPHTQALAETPQQTLKRHVQDQISKSFDCERYKYQIKICQAPAITESANASLLILKQMLVLEEQARRCHLGDTGNCLRQIPVINSLRKMKWCGKGSSGYGRDMVLLWYRCSGERTIINRAN